MKSRKIAVCIGGQIRTALESIKSFNSFFKDEDIDAELAAIDDEE
jgi:hypothetical protein